MPHQKWVRYENSRTWPVRRKKTNEQENKNNRNEFKAWPHKQNGNNPQRTLKLNAIVIYSSVRRRTWFSWEN